MLSCRSLLVASVSASMSTTGGLAAGTGAELVDGIFDKGVDMGATAGANLVGAAIGGVWDSVGAGSAF